MYCWLAVHSATTATPNLREQLGLDGELVSDCAVLTPLIQTLRDIPGVKALRDATRGGVNAVVHESRQPAVAVLMPESTLVTSVRSVPNCWDSTP